MSGAAIAAVVLAAGGSKRMGRPKVLLEIDGEPMVRRVAWRAAEAGCASVIVVAGAEAAGIERALGDLNVRIVRNAAWTEGIGTSIAAGVRVGAGGGAEAVMILLADQPDIGVEHLQDLIAAFGRGADPVATRYGEAGGVPAIFGKSFLPELAGLAGDRSAREFLSGATLVGTEAPADLDTPEDYAARNRR